MNPTDIAAIRADFAVITRTSEAFADNFFVRLFRLDPELRPLFPEDLAEQRRKLMKTLALVVEGLDRLDDIVDLVRVLASRLGDYGLNAEHYATVGEALLGAIEDGIGELDDRHRAAWGQAYAVLADAIFAAAQETVVPA